MSLKFIPLTKQTFHVDLKERVDAYFKSNNKSIKGDYRMNVKSIILVLAYFIPYFIIIMTAVPIWAMWLLTVVMGIALAGIGMNIMHDACHGSYSSSRFVNKLFSYTLNLVGGNKYNWIIQHNVLHHTYTNIYGEDEDISNTKLIRLSPFSDYSWYHRFQHIYSWFLYMMATLGWITIKDFKQFFRYKKEMHSPKTNYLKEFIILLFSKIGYYIYMVGIPFMALNVPLWMIVIGFLTMHFVAGFILTVTFQTAHVVENTIHETSVEKSEIADSWAVHQVKTTADFSRKSKFWNWYLGGLNFQIEHHLFPNICHIHYHKISGIIEETVKEHNLVFNEYSSFYQAVRSHYNMLKFFGRETVPLKVSHDNLKVSR
jgi:linoleoyl-CoA desaturase